MASTPPGPFERCTPGSADHRLRGAAGPYGGHAPHTVSLIQLAERSKGRAGLDPCAGPEYPRRPGFVPRVAWVSHRAPLGNCQPHSVHVARESARATAAEA